AGDLAMSRAPGRLDGLADLAVRWGVPTFVALLVIANAAGGLMPGVGYWDTGEFQTVLPLLGTAHPTGYPTYVLLGYVANLVLTPLGEPAFRINVLSLLCVAAAAAVAVALVRRLTGSTILGIAAGIGLALTPVVWTHATSADPHPLHLAFVAILLFVLVTWGEKHRRGDAHADRWLVVAAVVFGLSMGNHSLTLLLAIPVGLFVLATEPRIVLRGRFVLTCAIALVLTVTLVYLELPIRAGLLPAPIVYASPDTWSGFWYIALAEQFRGSLVDPLGSLGTKAGDVADLASQQFGLLAILIVPGFLATIRYAPRYALLTGTAMVITLVFNASYINADISRYYLGPVLWAWTWLAMLGAFVVRELGWLLGPRDSATDAGLREPASDPEDAGGTAPAGAGIPTPGPSIRAWAPAAVAVVVAAALLAPSVIASPSTRILADQSGNTDAASWTSETFAAVAQDAVIVSWWATSTPMWYAQKVEGQRPDVFIVDDRTMLDLDLGGATDVIGRYLGQRPVYVIRANPGDLGLVLKLYDLQVVLTPDGVPIGNGSTQLFQVVGTRPVNG
ncbi:MAG TPA: DUF2723 domain-containing protein, partial [Candidatus Limnocylindrales bacterium]|nr:DUF2723 domain-containing protein [Candidatus Limnocylindrales bacterium]